MPTAVLPLAPFSPWVNAASLDVAETVNLPAEPLHEVPSLI
jgi:hypothetical protein